MNKKFLFAVIAATVMGNAWADEGRVLTTQTYVDNADALKQDKIPAGTAGQIVLYNGTDANGQTKFTGRQITTTLITTNYDIIPTSGAILNYLAKYQQDLKLNHAWTRAEMNEGPLSKMGLGNDELYLIPDEMAYGNEAAIAFIKNEGDNSTLTTGAVVLGLHKLAKAKQNVLPAKDENWKFTIFGPDGTAGTTKQYGLVLGSVSGGDPFDILTTPAPTYSWYDSGPITDNYPEYIQNGGLPVIPDVGAMFDYGSMLLSHTQFRIPESGTIRLQLGPGSATNGNGTGVYDWLNSNVKGTGLVTKTSTAGVVGERKIIEESDVPNYQASSLSTNEKEIQKISIPTMGAVMAAISNNTPNLPTGTAGNVVTYNTSGQIGGSVATYTGAATYNATNDATKIPTMSGVTAWAQAKKVCIRWLDTPEHPEHNDENCLLWELPD